MRLSPTAFVLAGGLGTRLRPVVMNLPKPMAMVGGKPFIQILVDTLRKKGVRDFVLLTGYKGEIIEDYFSKPSCGQIDIKFCRESKPLGTGGAIGNAAQWATDPTLVVNGDTFFDLDLEKLIMFHESKGAAVTLSLAQVGDAGRYGSVSIDGNGTITGFHEKDPGIRKPGLINAGVSLLARRFIDSLPSVTGFSMEEEIFPGLSKSGAMAGLVQDCSFFDIGTPESYQAFIGYAQEKKL
jgi:D-glycero-alpha-D-manno-heptose 1-phosphate guanylyltransferase